MPSPLFEFFEAVADELASAASRVITRDDLKIDDQTSFVFDELKAEMNSTTTGDAVEKAVSALTVHFVDRGSQIPFNYDPITGRFAVVDATYLNFIKEMRGIRSIGKRAQTFECQVAERLAMRTIGKVHRVGWPRQHKKKSSDFNKYLRTLGFGKRVLFGQEKDGGLDILWLLPVGAVPHQPMVSLQCKNGTVDMDTAQASVGTGSISLNQHQGLIGAVHIPCVIFNDYIDRSLLSPKALNFVPLGLTDLASAALVPAGVFLI